MSEALKQGIICRSQELTSESETLLCQEWKLIDMQTFW